MDGQQRRKGNFPQQKATPKPAVIKTEIGTKILSINFVKIVMNSHARIMAIIAHDFQMRTRIK